MAATPSLDPEAEMHLVFLRRKALIPRVAHHALAVSV
jgi:hypothetical protein